MRALRFRRLHASFLALGAQLGCGSAAEPLVDLEGAVRITLCEGQAGVRVGVLDAPEGEAVLTDADGRFALEGVPASAQIVTTTEGYAPMITRFATHPESGAVIPMVRSDFANLVADLGGFAFDGESGAVAALVENDAGLPIGGVHVTLEARGGGPDAEALAARRRYVRFDGPTPTLRANDAGTITGPNAVVFFEVPEGEYTLRAEADEGGPIAPLAISARNGMLSVGRLSREGDEGAMAPEASGWITISSSFPDLTLLDEGLEGATVTVFSEASEESWTATTDAAGRYEIPLPFYGQRVAVRFSADGYIATRSSDFCFGEEFGQSFSAHARFYFDQRVAEARGAGVAAPGTGTVEVVVVADGTTLGGATLVTSAALGPVFYGQEGPWPICGFGACGPDDACPSGQRCEGGECVFGDAPLCRIVASAELCPEGYAGLFLASSIEGYETYCVPRVDECDPMGGQCPSGTYCRTTTDTSTSTVMLGESVCRPYASLRTVTSVGGEGMFVDVPPGDYEITATHPDFTFGTARFTVEADTTTRLALYPVAQGS
jgi:hypothetical protein